jgi:hypothetical protein
VGRDKSSAIKGEMSDDHGIRISGENEQEQSTDQSKVWRPGPRDGPMKSDCSSNKAITKGASSRWQSRHVAARYDREGSRTGGTGDVSKLTQYFAEFILRQSLLHESTEL